MRFLPFSILAGLTLVVFGSFNSASVLQGSAIKTIPLNFKPGATSTTVTGAVKGGAIFDYKFKGSGGQSLKATLTTKSTSLYFNLLAAEKQQTGEALEIEPRPIEQTEWQGDLPKDGEYVIRVYLNRSAARRGAAANYSLRVEIR
jgi:hypothetical protein